MRVKRKSYYDKAMARIINGAYKGLENGSQLMLDEVKKVIGGSGNVANKVEKQTTRESDSIKSRLFSSDMVIWVLQRGSGAYAEDGKHVGRSKTFIESGYRFWYVPASKADLSRYNYPYITLENGDILFLVHGQPPRHIFNVGFNSAKDALIKEVKQGIERELKR